MRGGIEQRNERGGGGAPPFVRQGPILTLGGALLSRHHLPPRRFERGRDAAPQQRPVIGLYFVASGQLCWGRGTGSTRCRTGDMLILDMTQPWSFVAEQRTCVVALLVPREFLTQALPWRRPSGAVRRTAALDAVRHFLDALLALEPDTLSAEQGAMTALAARELLTAAFVPMRAGATTGDRREATLLERVTDHIDANLTDPLDAAAIGRALGVSRSTLYRAAAPAGGIGRLVVERRLVALYALLRDPDERRSIADLARAHGFADAALFSRRFKRVFGTTAGQVRLNAGGRAGDDDPDPFHAMVAALPDPV